jgi:hypothetical protein
MSLRAAIAALGTRITFLVVAWLMLSRSARLTDVAIVAAAQLVSYIVFRQVAQRLQPLNGPADLLSVAVLAAMSISLSNVVVLAALAAGLSLLRAFGDRSSDAAAPRHEKPSRDTLIRVLLFAAGAMVGAAALWFGPVGALWANSMIFAVTAVMATIAPATGPEPSNVDTPPLLGLQADPLVRRLALTLFATNLLAQAGAVLLVALWAGQVTQTPRMLGLIAVAFMLGLLGAGVTFAGLTRNGATSMALALGCLAGGAAGYLFLLSRPPALLLVVAAALVTGVATASVIPLTGTLLSVHVPRELKSKVDGLLASVSYVGIPFGTVAAAWFLPRATALSGLVAAAGAYLVAMMIPVFVFRTWRQLLPDAPAPLAGASRLPARLTVTLAYANGQWIVEVRRGRALLGSRHLVKSAEAMNMLAVLDVPGVQDSVEKALTVDQVEATRQADRMRQELAELEARLAGLTEMVEITETHRPQPQPKQREADREPEEEVAK